MTDEAKSLAGQEKRRRRAAKRRPKRRGRKPKLESTLVIIDRLLLGTVRTSVNGKEVTITALEAIMYQLLQKEMADDARASRALLKFEELGRPSRDSRPRVEFVDNDYTRTFLGPQVHDHD